MKRILLSFLSIASFSAFATPFSVEKADLKWDIGNKWYMAVTAGQSIAGFTSSGTGVTWDLTGFEAGLGKDTVVASAATGGAGAVVNINSQIVPESNYTETATDYQLKTLNYGGINYPFDGSLSIGLPHEETSPNWNPSTTAFFQPVSCAGQVLASGQVVTSWGTFAAVLIQEDYNVAGNVATYYYWETKEYGRIAYLIGGSLSLMVDNNFDSPTSAKDVSIQDLKVYPNPANDQLNIVAEGLSAVNVFDAVGNLVFNSTNLNGQVLINTSNLNAGLYFVQSHANNAVSTKSVVIK